MPEEFIFQWVRALENKFDHQTDSRFSALKENPEVELIVVFLSEVEARALNLQFRQKDYATDILSFESCDRSSIGELVLCYDVVMRQSIDHNLSFEQECAYMILHGILHLLGFEHEEGGEAEKEMFAIQDLVFDELERGIL